VDAVFVGKERRFNRRFEQICGHYLVQPTACTPGAGWEKGQVENQVGTMRGRLFTPRLRFTSYDELNGYLLDRCIAFAKAQPHPEDRDRTIWDVFQDERPALIAYPGPFDGFHAQTAAVSRTCLVRFDGNKYSVMARAVGRPVEVRAYADRVVIRQDGEIVGEHPRRFGRGHTVYNPWHYVPVLARKPGALRNGAPFQDWVLPTALSRVRRKLAAASDGDRQMVDILTARPWRRHHGGRGGMRGGPRRRRPFQRRHSQHPRPPPAASGIGVDPDPRGSASGASAGGRLCPLRPSPRGRPCSAMRSSR
jgi:hypothetical protein